MQAIMETIFESGYLLFAVFVGLFLIIKSERKYFDMLFGIAILLLGIGDAFHLVPRMIALCTNGLESHAYSLGVGKLVTSITMTFFYVIAYVAICVKYKKLPPLWLNIVFGLLFLLRVVLCAMPQNNWTGESPYLWNILRNIPFVLMGIIIIVLSFCYCKKDGYLKWLWLLVVLSFAFYLVTALGASFVPVLGMMMLPKTICYIVIFVLALYSCIKEKK